MHRLTLVIFKNNQQSGFTLIEILIAVAILSFMSIAVFQITTESFDIKDSVTNEDREFLQVDRALERLNLDFTEIFTPLYFSHAYRSQNQPNRFESRRDFNSQQAQAPKYEFSDKFKQVTHHTRPIPYFENPDPSTFIFFTASNRRKYTNIKESRYAWVRYGLMPMTREVEQHRQAGGQRLVRQVQAQNIYSREHRWGEVQEQTLLNNVQRFIFEFWNPSTQRWVSSLELLNENRSRLALIKVTLEWIDPLGNEQVFSRVFRHYWTRYDPSIDEAAYREAARPQNQRGETDQEILPNRPRDDFDDFED